MTWHAPVLLDRVLEAAAGAQRAADGTVGDGGHAAALAERGVTVLGVDRDPEAVRRAGERLSGLPVTLLHGGYDEPRVLRAVAAFRPDFALLDLGVSSRQLDDPALGFSFRPGVPLDMRMDPTGPTAADYLNTTPAAELATAFATLSDERRGRRLAQEIVRRRARSAFVQSDDLVKAIRAVLGPRSGPADFARLFQAVRIMVNDELGRLSRALPALRDALTPGGVLAVISYHSGEDRLVKHTFRDWTRGCVCPPALPACACGGTPRGSLPTRRAVGASAAEIAANPRARSARLRLFRTLP
jgi:16S rRNA (cytosine1402-N4)-methyltransferase